MQETRNQPPPHSSIRSLGRAACGLLCAGIYAATLGCQGPPAVNPWNDDSIGSEAWTTPSAEGFRSAKAEPATRHRNIEETNINRSAGVPHYPLWWEDPFEDKGDMDGRYAWTWQDYFAAPYSFGRYILNTIGMPASVVLTPPATPMVSDGVVGRDHDARPGLTPDPTAEASDLGEPISSPPLEITGTPTSRPVH